MNYNQLLINSTKNHPISKKTWKVINKVEDREISYYALANILKIKYEKENMDISLELIVSILKTGFKLSKPNNSILDSDYRLLKNIPIIELERLFSDREINIIKELKNE